MSGTKFTRLAGEDLLDAARRASWLFVALGRSQRRVLGWTSEAHVPGPAVALLELLRVVPEDVRRRFEDMARRKEVPVPDPAALNETVAKLGLTLAGLGRLTHRSPRAVQFWINGRPPREGAGGQDQGVPPEVRGFLALFAMAPWDARIAYAMTVSPMDLGGLAARRQHEEAA